MGIIVLEKLPFKAYHGYYEEERELGNHFEVTLTIHTDFEQAAVHDDLNGTVDYAEVYAIVKDQMQHSSKLLENVAHRIASHLLEEIPAILKVEVSLSKLKAPIGGPCQAATIIYEKSRS
jgi:dihydroneopterin aldolase